MGESMSTQMATAPASLPGEVTNKTELLYVQLARELAMDIHSLDKILAARSITPEQFEEIKKSPRFNAIYSRMVQEWESSLNTGERVRLKALAFVEESLPEYFQRAHDRMEALPAKVEILKAVAKIGGIDSRPKDETGGGEKFSVTINLGGDSQVRIEKDVTPKVIDQ